MFISFFKNRLTEYMTQTCYADLTSSSICDTDYSFKSLFEMEYLSFYFTFILDNICVVFDAQATSCQDVME